jgi:6-phosphogluconolactonase
MINKEGKILNFKDSKDNDIISGNGSGRILVGTYSEPGEPSIFSLTGDSNGLYSCLKPLTDAVRNPSYLEIVPDRKMLYCVCEDTDETCNFRGSVAAFRIKRKSLEYTGIVETEGRAPCHVLADTEKNLIYAANYESGSVAVIATDSEGKLNKLTDCVSYPGYGPDPVRQAGPHCHCCRIAADGINGLWVSDLGSDRILRYYIDRKTGKLIHCGEKDIIMPPGCGPRHFIIDPNNSSIMYAVTELTSELFTFKFKSSSGKYEQIGRTNAVGRSEKKDVKSFCAAIKTDASGKKIYISNRGDDSISVFSAYSEENLPQIIGRVPVMGRTPRDIIIQNGQLLSANQDSDSITVFSIGDDGIPVYTGITVACHRPVCLVYDNSDGV